MSDLFVQHGGVAAQVRRRAAFGSPQGHRSVWTVQDKDRLLAGITNVDMSRFVIARIDDDQSAVDAQDCGHASSMHPRLPDRQPALSG